MTYVDELKILELADRFNKDLKKIQHWLDEYWGVKVTLDEIEMVINQ